MIFENPLLNSSEIQVVSGPTTKTLSPVVVGGSVIGIYYKDGVLLATDSGACYGSIKMFPDCSRIERINENVLISSNGEMSDFQEITYRLQEMERKDSIYDDNVHHTPKDYANYLARIHYEKRNKFNPYYLFNVLAGFQNGKRYLASVDLYGTLLESNWIATGFAGYLCKPIIHNYWNENMSEEEARTILLECFKILLYRNTKAFEKIVIAKIDAKGTQISEPVRLDSKWDFENFKNRANENLYSDKKFY